MSICMYVPCAPLRIPHNIPLRIPHNISVYAQDRDGNMVERFHPGQSVSLTIWRLLELAGVELDGPSGVPADKSEANPTRFLPNRLTGVKLVLEMYFQNYGTLNKEAVVET